jgi:hypothetical protein
MKMEEGKKSKKKKLIVSKVKASVSFKCNSFTKESNAQKLIEKPRENKHKSCKNFTNFVPRISPKKSFCKPSLFILNPDEKFAKKFSEDQTDKDFLFIYGSDSEGNSSELESNEDEMNENNIKLNKNLFKEEKKEVKNDSKEETINTNSNQNQDFDFGNKLISNLNEYNNNECNNNENNRFFSILDILSMNEK